MARKILILGWLVLALPSDVLADGSMMRLPFSTEDKAWIFTGTEPYEGWADRRALFVLYHPWAASQDDGAGMVSRDVQVPADWQGGVQLHFYMTDDYFGRQPMLSKDSWLGQIKLIGHRYKQILVDDEVIWDKDVADCPEVSEPSRFSVLLPERVKPGDSFRLGFRLIDKVGSDVSQPGDYRHIGTTDGIQESDEWRFMTHLYIGDVTLTPARIETVPPVLHAPSARLARAVHEKRWPLEPYGEKVTLPVALTWEHWADVTPETCVLRCGVPLPAGRARETSQIVLRDKAGKRLPLQVNKMNHWEDGTLRWVELDAIAPANENTRELLLDISKEPSGADAPTPEQPVSITSRKDNEIILQTGEIAVTVGGTDACLLRRAVNGDLAIENLTGELEVGGNVYRTIVDTRRVLAEGPIRAEVELSGKLKSTGDEIGRFVFRLSAFAGQPYVRMTWRIFNDRAETLKVSRFELLGRYTPAPGSVTCWGDNKQTGGPDVCLRQWVEDRFEVTDGAGEKIDTGKTAGGWLAARNDGQTMQLFVRHFYQQFPKALELKNGRLRIALFEPSPDRPHYLPTEGEAKRHEIWLGLWDRSLPVADLRRFARCFARPARLFNADYYCASGGFGYAARHDEKRFPDFDDIVKQQYGEIEPKRFYVNDIRHWGDYPYGKTGNWCNGYYDAPQGMASEYLMSGDPRWFDHLEATVRHIIDIDVCHASAAHPEWVGTKHCGECGPNHTSAYPWDAMQRIKGWLALWRLTGDIDVRQDALGAADAVIRRNRGIGCTSVRDHAGILYCLTAAYDETQDPKYLEAAKRVTQNALTRIETRRGCYPEVHGNVGYRGNVPWMCAQLCEPLYYYYRQSGDVEAAIALVGLTESILTENRTRDVLGDVYGYSHNPHFKKTAGYHVLIAPAVLYAYELTRDEYYLANARAMYAQMIRERSIDSVRNCYWNVPALLYYLQRFGLPEAK